MTRRTANAVSAAASSVAVNVAAFIGRHRLPVSPPPRAWGGMHDQMRGDIDAAFYEIAAELLAG